MVDKKVAVCVMLVLLIMFTAVIVYLYNQWKHLPSFSSLDTKPPTAVRTLKNPKLVLKKRESRCPVPLNPLSNTQVCSVSSKPPASGVPPPQQQAQEQGQQEVNIQAQPRVVPEPNFNCSPLTTFAPRVEREYVIYVDSACRDFSIFPTPQEYYFKFPVPLYNVTSVDIIQALLPRGQYDINTNNRIFYMQEPPNDPVPVVIPLGDYADETALATAITTAMAASLLMNTYTCVAFLYRLSWFKTGGPMPDFQILLTQEYDPYGLVRQVLGFPPGIFPVDPISNEINAPFRTVLNSIEYVDIVAPEISKNYYGSPMLARIPVLGGLNGVTEYDPQTIGTRTFWPVQRLTGLTLQFFAGPTCPINKLLYNFNGLENSLTLRITCQEYKNIFIDDFCIEQMV